MPALSDLERRRAFACRLTPDRALRTLDEAHEFLEDRGLLTLMPDCSLPSLFGACHEEPYGGAGARGFASWPKTKYPWAFRLVTEKGALWTRLHRGKGLYLSARVARLVAPRCLAELDAARAGEHGEDERRIVAHLETAGPSTTEELKEELGLDPRSFKRARDRLERVGAVVDRSIVVELPDGRHRHTSEHRLWDVPAEGDSGEPLRELLVAAARAAVVAPEREALRWFSWPIGADALEDERLFRLDSGRLAAR